MPSFQRLLAACLPAFVLACTGMSDTPAPLALRAGVQALEVSTEDLIYIRAVGGAGDHLAILVSPRSHDFALWLSDDRGKTFRRYALPGLEELSHRLSFELGTGYAAGIHVTLDHDTKAPRYTLVVAGAEHASEDVGGSVASAEYLDYQLIPLEVEGGTAVPTAAHLFGFAPPQGTEDGFVSYRVADEDRFGVGHVGDGEGEGHYEGLVYDAATEQVTQTPFLSFNKTTPPCRAEFSYQFRYSALALQGYCGTGQSICLSTALPASGAVPHLACVPRGSYPGLAAELGRRQLRTARGLVEVYRFRGRALAAGIRSFNDDAGQAIGPFDLGPGEPVDDVASGFLQHRYAPLVPVDEPGNFAPIDRLVLVPPTGLARDVVLPPTPCANLLDCAGGVILDAPNFGQLEWAVPLGHDDYLAIYHWRDATQERIYASVEHDQNVPGPGQGKSATALELACERESMCFTPTVVGFDFDGCVNRWVSMHGASDEADRAYQAFLATTGCDGFLGTDPQGHLGQCTPGCAGDTASQCDPWVEITNCAEHGLTCSAGQCVDGIEAGACGELASMSCDAQGRLVQCPTATVTDCRALGMACSEQKISASDTYAACTLADSCTGDASRCVGDEVLLCVGGHEAPVANCARAGLACTNGWCNAPPLDEQDCNSSANPPTCTGDKLTYCFQGTLRAIDCASLGGHCGKPDTFGARCLP